jgi:hypothetical protein
MRDAGPQDTALDGRDVALLRRGARDEARDDARAACARVALDILLVERASAAGGAAGRTKELFATKTIGENRKSSESSIRYIRERLTVVGSHSRSKRGTSAPVMAPLGLGSISSRKRLRWVASIGTSSGLKPACSAARVQRSTRKPRNTRWSPGWGMSSSRRGRSSRQANGIASTRTPMRTFGQSSCGVGASSAIGRSGSAAGGAVWPAADPGRAARMRAASAAVRALGAITRPAA